MSLDRLRDLLDRHLRPEGTTAVDGVRICRADHAVGPETAMSGTVLAIIAQGHKRLALADRVVEYGAGQYLVASVDLPLTGHFVDTVPGGASLGFGVTLGPAAIAELLLAAGPGELPRSPAVPGPGIAVSDAPDELLDAVVRLLRLLDRPRDRKALAPLFKREILWRLITGEQGDVVRGRVRSLATRSASTPPTPMTRWRSSLLCCRRCSGRRNAPTTWSVPRTPASSRPRRAGRSAFRHQVAVAARRGGGPLRTAQRRPARYRADGLVGLARTARTDAGGAGFPPSWSGWSGVWRWAGRAVGGHHRETACAGGDRARLVGPVSTVHAIVAGTDPHLRSPSPKVCRKRVTAGQSRTLRGMALDATHPGTADRRAAIAAARDRAGWLRDAAAAGEALYPAGAWERREREALDALRTVAAFLSHHGTDPVAQAITSRLGGTA